ncbi:MAG: HDIG domain-containing protein [Clostridia bacterium]|nr:HDIG domain-containing protein [Clostridia bacterium]
MSKLQKALGSKTYFYTAISLIFAIVISAIILVFVNNDFADIINLTIANPILVICVFAVVLVALLTIFVYMYAYDRDKLLTKRYFVLICLGILLTTVLTCLSSRFVNMYFLPILLSVIIAVVLVGRKCAIAVNIASTIIVGTMFLVSSTLGITIPITEILCLTLTTLLSGCFAVPIFKRQDTRYDLVKNGVILSVVHLIVSFMLNLVCTGELLVALTNAMWQGLSALATVALFMILLPMLELIFNLLTAYRLNEYCTFKHPLLKRLFREAPGTFNHSVSIANLAEMCAIAIGADAPLARAGAYFHDVGKLRSPEYFVENQVGGYNPHDDIIPEVSARAILSHTNIGYDLLMQYRFPKQIADIAREHHGDSALMYFFNKAQKITEGKADINAYSYAGPRPSTKEAAIVMTCDVCEAAVRAQADKPVYEVVEAVVTARIQADQYSDAPLTFKEIEIIKETITAALSGAYHKRIDYNPKL